MTRALAPEDAFQLELEQPSSDESANELVALAMRLRAIGTEIQAPDSLRARRGALLGRSYDIHTSIRLFHGWRRARALLIAAVLTLLTVVGAAAATLADRWPDLTGDEGRRTAPLVVPSPEGLEDERPDGSTNPASPITVVDGPTNGGRDDGSGIIEEDDEAGEHDDEDVDDEPDGLRSDGEDGNDDRMDGDGSSDEESAADEPDGDREPDGSGEDPEDSSDESD